MGEGASFAWGSPRPPPHEGTSFALGSPLCMVLRLSEIATLTRQGSILKDWSSTRARSFLEFHSWSAFVGARMFFARVHM